MAKIIQITAAIAMDGSQQINKILCLDDEGNVMELVGKKLVHVTSMAEGVVKR